MVYQVDDEGHLMDEDGNYILDESITYNNFQ
jgi:hypothetical protein